MGVRPDIFDSDYILNLNPNPNEECCPVGRLGGTLSGNTFGKRLGHNSLASLVYTLQHY